jgi:hypothetical protein
MSGATTTTGTVDTRKPTTQPRQWASSQVSWWAAREFALPLLESVGSWPTIGSPAWVALDDADPRKLAAVFDACQHWALRLETSQQAQCEAAREVSAAADWSAIAREVRDRNEFYEQRPWLRRAAS